MNRKKGSFASVIAGLIALLYVHAANATLIHAFDHVYGYGADPSAIVIDLNVYDGQPGGKYLWEYTVTNHSFDPIPGTSNGFSGFELYLPSPIPEIADITPNPGTTPPWDIDCCSGNPTEWDTKNALGIMPGYSGVFSFTTDPRAVAINDTGWFHTFKGNIQSDIIPTSGMHVPWVPGLNPIPEPATLALVGLGLAGLGLSRLKRVS